INLIEVDHRAELESDPDLEPVPAEVTRELPGIRAHHLFPFRCEGQLLVDVRSRVEEDRPAAGGLAAESDRLGDRRDTVVARGNHVSVNVDETNGRARLRSAQAEAEYSSSQAERPPFCVHTTGKKDSSREGSPTRRYLE